MLPRAVTQVPAKATTTKPECERTVRGSLDEAVTATEPPAIGYKDAYKFFVPLMFMAELMFISHAAVAAFLARMSDPEPILAAYSSAFYMHSTLGSPMWALQLVFLSFIKDRASVFHLARFSVLVLMSIGWMWIVICFTPAGDWLIQSLFGASAEVAGAARLCMFLSLLGIPIFVVRAFCYCLMMQNRRTMLVTYGTVVRLVSLGGILLLCADAPEHAAIGVLALTGCILLEMIYAVYMARPFWRALPRKIEDLPSYRKLWRFSWPIMVMQTTETGVAFTTNFFLGRLLQPELAIAAFGVLDSLVRVLLSPLRNLTQTCQALAKRAEDQVVLLWFSAQVGLLFMGVMLLFFIPEVRDLALQTVMGLSDDMADYVAPAMWSTGALAVCMAAATVSRGLLIVRQRTGALAVASGARLASVIVVGVVALATGVQNGAIIGLVALTVAFGAEALILGGQLFILRRGR